MTIWAVFYYDGNYNSSCLINDTKNKLDIKKPLWDQCPEVFATAIGEAGYPVAPLINGVINITGALNPEHYLDGNDAEDITMITLTPHILF